LVIMAVALPLLAAVVATLLATLLQDEEVNLALGTPT